MKTKKRLAAWGQVVCKITGEEPLKFINFCREKKIILYGVKKEKDTYICAMSVADFFEIRKIKAKTGVRIHIIKRKGIPFLLQRLKKRYICIAGTIGMLVALYVCSGFIWDIRIKGNEALSDQAVLSFLQTENIYCGMRKRDVMPQNIASVLRKAFPEIGWVSVEKTGTVIEITIKEVKRKTNTSDHVQEGSLYADKEGKIHALITRTGICKVNKGEWIYPGDLLVTGEIPFYDDSGGIYAYAYCRADADIVLETARVYYDRIDYKHSKRVYNAKKISGVQFKIADAGIQIYQRNVKGDMYVEGYKFQLSNNFVLPLTVNIYYTRSFTENFNVYTKSEAATLLQEHFSDFFMALRKNVMRITANNVKIFLYEDYAVATGILYVQEKTGILAETVKHTIDSERNSS